MSAQETKEKILNTTMDLIKERHGDVSNVTIRTIADRAGIGVGLTNHYFKSKDVLIEECVDRIFSAVFEIFGSEEIGAVQTGDSNNGASDPVKSAAGTKSPSEITKLAARRVMDYLLDNAAIATAAFGIDAKKPGGEDYSARLAEAFAYCMVDKKKLEEMLSSGFMSDKMKQQLKNHSIKEQRIRAFMLTGAIKETFIRRDYMLTNVGIDMNDAEKRGDYIDELVDRLM